jgi:DNA-binding NtrC family response regulator
MTAAAPKILIVDDEPPLLKMMGLYLTRKGYSVITMDSTDRAWAAVESSAGELTAAVLDATMRGMPTEDLALKLMSANPSLIVVVASGYPVDMSPLERAGHGRVQFVQKPFTAEMLAGTLRRLIGAQEEEI